MILPTSWFEGGDTGFRCVVTEQPGMPDVPGREVTERTAALVLMFYAHRLTRARTACEMLAPTRLDARLLVGADDHVVGAQWHPVPHSLVQVKDRSGFLFEAWATWEDPAPELPGTDGVLNEPPPDGGAADLGDDAPACSFGDDFGGGVA